MSKVISINGLRSKRQIEKELDRLQKKLLIPNIAERWPEWEAAFDEAKEYEQKFGYEKALEIFKCRCPFDLENDDE